MMTKQVNIRSDTAHELVVKMSKRHGKSITALIEEALVEKDARDEAALEERRQNMHNAISKIQAFVRDHPSDFKIEDLYDEDGLPC